MPTKDQLLYKCWNGELETAIFVEQSLADKSCTIETWVVRIKNADNKTLPFYSRVRCSVDSYYLTEHEAWENEFKRYKEGIAAQRKHIKELQSSLRELIVKKATIREKMIESKLKISKKG